MKLFIKEKTIKWKKRFIHSNEEREEKGVSITWDVTRRSLKTIERKWKFLNICHAVREVDHCDFFFDFISCCFFFQNKFNDMFYVLSSAIFVEQNNHGIEKFRW